MVGRVPAAALGLVFVVRTKELTGSFAAAGAASGLNAIANAVSSPALGRLVDRRGQPLVLLSGAAACALALAVFATLREGATLAAIAPCALVAGAPLPPPRAWPPALWPSLLRVHARAPTP